MPKFKGQMSIEVPNPCLRRQANAKIRQDFIFCHWDFDIYLTLDIGLPAQAGTLTFHSSWILDI